MRAEAEEREFLIPHSFDVDTGKQNTKPLLICSRNPCRMGHHQWRHIYGFWAQLMAGADMICDACGDKTYFQFWSASR